jgi:hypothetical protein
MTMKTLSTFIAAAAILTALASPSLAAQRSRAVVSGDVNTVRTYGDLDPANPPYRGSAYDAYASGAVTERAGPQYSGQIRDQALSPAQHVYSPANGSPNLPYPDRPYGDPDID